MNSDPGRHDPHVAPRWVSYELPLSPEHEVFAPVAARANGQCRPTDIVLQNVRWYISCRWIVILVFLAFGSASLVPRLFVSLGLRPNLSWPFRIAGLLLALNAAYVVHFRAIKDRTRERGAFVNLWMQIIFDLLVVTATVYFTGSTETAIAFIYLFHIVLACIFLSRRQSLTVTALSIVLYTGCVSLELWGRLPPVSVYAIPRSANVVGTTAILNVVLSGQIWLVVWVLASHLSSRLRRREQELEVINIRLIAAQKERMQHMLHTTHELKAPFAAIQANTQMLQKGYCGDLPPEALEVVERIAARSEKLARTIREMLQLANLQSESEQHVVRQNLDLSAILRWCVEQVKQMAREREIAIEESIPALLVDGVSDHLKMLFLNLLSNAVTYSRKGGLVRIVAAGQSVAGAALVTIEDQGIGIAAEKLPRVFDEYYHTNEALAHNPNSTGLGLAIVGRIAALHRIGITVESAPECGTRVMIRIRTAE